MLNPSLRSAVSTAVKTNGSTRPVVVEPTPLHPTAAVRRVAIVGTGYVGLVTGTCLAELGNFVICLDNDTSKVAALRRGELPFFEPQLYEMMARNRHAGRLVFSDDIERGLRDSAIVFIAVGTPTRHDNTADLSAIWAVAAAIGRQLNGPKVVVLKSTVPVETTELVSTIIAEKAVGLYPVEVVSNPEFLCEGSAVADFMNPDRIILGTSSPNAEAIMRELYAPLAAPFVVTDIRTSEMIKYAANAFLATKVSFMNEIANICELVGVDVKAVGHGIGLDERIGNRFMNPGIGYGGSCFPKDVLALERVAHGRNYDATLLRCVDAINRAQIERTFVTLEKALGGSIDAKKICVLGLAFKPNTSDIREAPALRLIDLLLRSGATVTAHDPIAIENARGKTGDAVTYCAEMYDAIDGSDALVLATEWNQYESLNFRIVRKLMRGNIIFDGRNVFDPDDVVTEGLRYIGIGRAKEPTRSLTYADGFED